MAASTLSRERLRGEYGSWTPVATFATPGDLSSGFTTQVGRWVLQPGRVVSAWFVVLTSSWTHTTASGNLYITGLPFVPDTGSSGIQYFGPLVWKGITFANTVDLRVQSGVNGSDLSFLNSRSANSPTNMTITHAPSGGTLGLRGFIRYVAV